MARDTIFSPSFGNRPTYLVGREAVLGRLIAGLESVPGSRERSTIMLGQRGTGKTVLLWELADRAEGLGFVVASPTVVSEDLLTRVVEKIQERGARYARDPQNRLTGGSVGALGFSVGLEFSPELQETKSNQFKLTQLARRLTQAGHGILILVDELQANSPEVRQLVTVYQEMVGERLNVALVMAGLPGAVSATLNDKVLTFLNRSSRLELAPLSLGDVDAYYSRAFHDLGLSVTDERRARAVEFTRGSPYLMQLVGHNIVVRAAADGAVSDDDLARALSASQADFERDVCETTLSSLSGKDVEFLCAMARDDGPSRTANVADRMDATVDYAQKYRRRLIDAGVIEVASRGYVRFAVPFLRDYLRDRE